MKKYNNKKIIEFVKIVMMVGMVVAVTCFPYRKEGLSGYFPDLMYHMLRIEGVKEALLEGIYPIGIYTNFFNGYGYGSPLFYPDIFLIFPAFLRILSIEPLVTWKIFAGCIAITGTLTTFFSIRHICKDSDCSIAATFLIMLSQFWLADLIHRVGISEYLAFVFIPVLIAGIYDFFVFDGNKTYLMGVGLVGLLLSHTIMTFIALAVTLITFVMMIFVKKDEIYLFNKCKMKKLVITAVCTLLVCAYYIFPMLEQMSSDTFQYSTPWAAISNNTQPFSSFFRTTGYFSLIAYVGIGVPILVLLVVCLCLKKPKNKGVYAFLISGIVLFLISTPIFPWIILEKTIFNMIQFTYRLWPFAILFVVIGIALVLEFNLKNKKLLKCAVVTLISMSSIIAGLYQNNNPMVKFPTEYSKQISEDYLKTNNNYVGAGEWLPVDISEDVEDLNATTEIVSEGNYKIYPLIYYKGYTAWVLSENGEKINIPIEKSEQGLVKVYNEFNNEDSEIYVEYTGTVIQEISKIISVVTIGIMVVYKIVKYREKKG